MPARSKAQQRLMGMVHAYNTGRLNATGALRRRLEAISSGMSDADAAHFAATSHAGLPGRVEKSAQHVIPYDRAVRLASKIPYADAAAIVDGDDEGDHSLFKDVGKYSAIGAALGSLLLGTHGAIRGNYVAKRDGLSDALTSRVTWGDGARLGLRGLLYGGIIGTAAGLGRGVMRKYKENK